MNNNMTKTNIPALDIPLAHVHLIEASAGTGKTWTLAALVLRLLVEKKRPCEQIIATTFTRAAAAEMRERIRGRIVATKALIDDILLLPKQQINLTEHNVPAVLEQIKAQLAGNATAETLADPLNGYLVAHLLDEEKKQSSGELTTKKAGLLWAKNHLELTLIQLDKLFVGTLDSLCQKLLREFAFDLLLQQGQGKPLSLTESDNSTVTELIHDAIRIWRTQQHAKNPQLMTLLAETNKLTDVGDLTYATNKALNFMAEPLAAAPAVAVGTDKLDQQLAQLAKADDTDLVNFFSPHGEYYPKFWKNRVFQKHGVCWQDLKHKLISHKAAVTPYLTAGEQSLLAGFTEKLAGNFSSKNKDIQATFEAMPMVQMVQKITDTLSQIKAQLDALREHQNYFVCHYVRTHLPEVLQAQGKTTFALQMRQLNNALAGEQGAKLAQQIRHRYPVALIDECQDVNADQAGMIYRIYQHGLQEADLKKGCLLLVGDPKQAIYGFRGGDIHNYQRIKNSIDAKNHHTLDTNRRSQTALVRSLNHVFGSRDDLLENVAYQEVNAHGRDDVLLDETGKPLADLLCHLSSEHTLNADEPSIAELLAQKISELLATHTLKLANGQVRSLAADDIAILFKTRWDVVGVVHQLHKRGIATFMGTSSSVFAGSMAADMAAIMQAMLSPQHLASVRRALASVVFGCTQADLAALLQDKPVQLTGDAQPVDFAQLQFAFAEAGKTWQRFGFLAAWQQLNEPFALWQRLASAVEGERHLVDVRHLLEIIQTQALQHKAQEGKPQQAAKTDAATSEHTLMTWFLRQLSEKPKEEWALQRRLPSASGVQMMSIHKSKGLDFPIVFVLGVDNSTRKSKKLQDVFLTLNQGRMQITASAGMADTNILADNQRRYAEDLRVTYVAFTRPSQVLYVVTPQSLENAVISKNKAGKQTGIKENALAHWLVEGVDFREDIAQQFAPAVVDMAAQHQLASEQAEETASTQPPALPPQRHFKAWRATSFSALSRELDTSTATQAAHEPEYVIEEVLTQVNSEQTFTNTKNSTKNSGTKNSDTENSTKNSTQNSTDSTHTDMRFAFVRGANAGSFLHKVFEKLDFTEQKNWAWLIANIAQQFGIAQAFARYEQTFDDAAIQQLQTWFLDVLHTPLSAGVSLADIPARQRLPEMGFNLGLNVHDFSADKLSKVMHSAGFAMTLPPQTKLFRYLKGEIDLIYEQAGKFYVLDYKSNHLGEALADYSQAAMQYAMSHAGYWLQAAIYLVALHRYLQVRLPDYQPEKHLGGVEYAFIRGMHPKSLEIIDGKTFATGVISWQPTVDFVLALDAVFGNRLKNPC